MEVKKCFNPCFNGTYSLTITISKIKETLGMF